MNILKKTGLVCCAILFLISVSGCGANVVPQEETSSDTQQMSLLDIWESSVLISENEKLKMTLNISPLNILVEDKSSGKVWSTNPIDVDSDTVAVEDLKAFLKSQLTFSYIINRNLTTVESYTECDETEQYQVYQIPNGVRIEYTFGEIELTDEDIPMQLTQKRADQLFLKNESLTDQEKEYFTSCYSLDEETGAWIYSEYNFGEKVDNLLEVFRKIEYSANDLKQDAADFGESLEVAEKLGFVIPVEYILDGENFLTRIPVDEIIYPKNNPILDLTLNGYFGASSNDEEGYILTPDGCGALMRFGDIVRSEVRMPMYGRDMITADSGAATKVQPALLPVYGLKSGEHAFFGIIEEGDAVASLNVIPALYNSSYNSVSTSFMLHAKGTMTLGVQDTVNEVDIIQEQGYTGDIVLRYRFFSGEKSNYLSMAEYYRDYLLKNEHYQLQDISEDMPFFFETVGAITGQKSFLGIHYQGSKVLTDFNQTAEMIQELKDNGISNTVTKVSGWMNGGYEQEVIKNLKVVGAIGGEKGLQKLYGQSSNIFPNIRMLTTSTSKGLSLTKDVARKIDEQYARTYIYDMQQDDYLAAGYILSPSRYSSLMDDFLKAYQKYKINTLCIEDIGNGVYGDYGKERDINRQKAVDITEDVLQKLSDYQLMLVQANVHTAKFADYVLEVPMDSNHYFSLDDSVPFYQMVMRGFFQYTGTALNLSAQNTNDFLRYVQYGAMPYYKVIGQEFDQIEISEIDDLYSVEFDSWSEQMITQYERAEAVLEPVKNAGISGYSKIDQDVYCTEFDNGQMLLVNYSQSDWNNESIKVPAESFVLTNK